MTRLRPGRSGRSCNEEITCEDRAERVVDRPVRTPPPADADFAAARVGAVLAVARAAVVFAALRDGVVFAVVRAGAVFRAGRVDAWVVARVVVPALVAALRAGIDLRAAVAFAAGVVLRGAAFRAPAVVVVVPAVPALRAAAVALPALRAVAVDLRAVAVCRVVPVADAVRAGPVRLAGVAFARPAVVRVCFVPALFVVLARPAGPLLPRAAPPDRRVLASLFTSSGLRRAEMPETPYRRNWPRMSSTRIREISDSEIRGVFGVWLPVCRLVLVAVPPRPVLLR
ncbi:hypothetical protein OIE53_24980 [Micromonospora sp. NBC_01739]|nr:hypothetical protein OIE53_24980 [Micromonospora sp. NBC_01739]